MVTLNDLAEDWRYDLKAQNLAPRTITGYISVITGLSEFLENPEVTEVRSRHIKRYIIHLIDTEYRDSSIRRFFTTIGIFFNWAVSEGEIKSSPMQGVKAPEVSPKLTAVLTAKQTERLLSVFTGQTFNDRRNQAILHLFKDTGMRLEEMTLIKVENLDIILQQVRITGKGRKDRVVPFTDRTTLLLRRYLRARKEHRHSDSEYLWLSRQGNARISTVEKAVRDAGKETGITVHPHMFRHTFCHNWLEKGGQERTLMALMGWESTAMLAIYAKSTAQTRAIKAYRDLYK